MSEDVIWQILDEQFCSFKAKFDKKSFCKNEYNLTGMCNKMYCPLANGRYATVREEDGVLYLHVKTIERAHSPANLWEKIRLPEDMGGALAIINENLAFWPRRFVNKVKERLVRLQQYLIRYRKWYYRAKPRLVTVHKKFERREQRRELKSIIAAKVETHILQELEERYSQGIYDEFINLNNPAYLELLREHKRREQKSTRKKSKGDKDEDSTSTAVPEIETDSVEFTQGLAFKEDIDDDEEEEEEDEDILDMEEEEQEEEREEEEEPEIELDLDDEAHSELNRLKKKLAQYRKRKAEQKTKTEKKQSKTKRTKYGPTVEIEYENTPQANTTSSYN